MAKKSYTLHLNLKKKWFDLINSGKKLEEYREIKPYWIGRLGEVGQTNLFNFKFKPYRIVIFKNGWFRLGKKAPECAFEIQEISIGFGKPEWGGDKEKQKFIIKLGPKLLRYDDYKYLKSLKKNPYILVAE